ncbi:MAG: DNA-binding transcriptional regulator [Candidatus Liptonbacteria bacterium]|nr:DNA-binding transcriptional regulator [Candidatus Liptonbacteria bacterium]
MHRKRPAGQSQALIINTEALCDALLRLKEPEEVCAFLRDLLTPEEIAEFGRRWLAARLLAKKVPYTEIQKQTGLSSTTVARVQKWLTSGAGGYKLVLKRLARN